MIKKKLFLMPMAAILFAACGDSVETINQMGMEVVDSTKDLPKCNKDNEGEQAFVKGETSARVCIDGEWISAAAGNGSNGDFSCTAKELSDKSGLKIICNGDSIGVVLNGEKGETGDKGDNGVGCTISGQTDSTVTIACGDKKLTMDMNGGFSVTESILDSEKVAVSLDSLAGYTQKGPFLKGSTVYLYELSDGRTLKQTNGNFTSKITRDDGHYKFTARDLASQYAMIVVDGHYRNEVTGSSDGPLRLTALTDMRKRSSTNVNLLTHLEYDRVYQLVTRGDSTGKKLTVKQAKRQAQKEILKQFYIELDDNTDAEDMDVFGSSDADAALLAISILLQFNRNTTDLSVLLTEISNDIAEYGEWKNDSAKTAIAGWAMGTDVGWGIGGSYSLAKIKQNVANWKLGSVPNFEKYVRNYWTTVFGIGECNEERDGVVMQNKNAASEYRTGVFTCDNGLWRRATDFEITHNQSCLKSNYGAYTKIKGFYKCGENGWEITTDTLAEDSLLDERDGQVYKTIGIGRQLWMAENLNYAYEGSASTSAALCAGGSINCNKKYGRLYSWNAAQDNVCPNGWHLPTAAEFDTLIYAISGIDINGINFHLYDERATIGKKLKSKSGWNEGGNGTDEFGFTVNPAGGSEENTIGLNTGFWTSTGMTSEEGACQKSGECAIHLGFSWDSDTISVKPLTKFATLSVRCITDEE